MQLFEFVLILLAALQAEAAVEQLEGYVHVYGECEGYVIQTYRSTSYTQKWCKGRCDALKECAGFLWMATGNSHKTLAKSQGCLLTLRVCSKGEYTSHTTAHHMYIKIGHIGMIAPGYDRFPGKCAGVEYKYKAASQDSVKCAKYCRDDPKCESFFLTSDRKCHIGHGACSGKPSKMETNLKIPGFTFVMKARNVAQQRSATGWAYVNPNYHSYAVDGWRDGFANRKSCYISQPTSHTPWWRVTLVAYYPVKKIAITNRADCCSDKNYDFDIFVGDDKSKPKEQLCSTQTTPFAGTTSHECQEYILGTYVAIRMKDKGSKRALTLCEVEVYEQPKVEEIENYEMEKGFYCNGNRVRAQQTTKTPEECARICSKMASCGTFQRTSTTCYFMIGCPETQRLKSASYQLYNRLMHSHFEISGYSHTAGRCTSFKMDIKQYSAMSVHDCAKKCNKWEDCETFEWYSHSSVANYGTCRLSKQGICDAPNEKQQYYHIYERMLVNLALRKKSYQSSTFGNNVADRSSDGIIGLFTQLATCSKTEPDRINWWAVDLQFNTRVKKVYTYGLKREKMADLTIIVSNERPRPGHELEYVKADICDKLSAPVTKRAGFQCGKNTGRYLAVLQQSAKKRAMTLCEVVVMGFKNFDVHGYTEEDGQCMNHGIEKKQGVTPGDCADMCNKNPHCAAFVWYEDTSERYHCETKASACRGADGKDTLKNKGDKRQKYRTYIKEGHPGLTIAGFERKLNGYVTLSYSVKNLSGMKLASPEMCARECNLRRDCHAITMRWTTSPYCYIQKRWPTSLDKRFTKSETYTTFIRQEPNIGVGRKTMGVGRWLSGAVDGNTDGIKRHQSCFISKPVKGQSWWALDFEKPHTVKSVRIWNRSECCHEQLKQLVVVVSDNQPPGDHDATEVCATYDKPTTKKGGMLKLNCKYPIAGQYLIMKKDGHEELSLCEVSVNGVLWTDKNVALKKKTDSSGSIGNSPSSKAVDGKINTNIQADTCAATRPSAKKSTTWWSVDLEKVHAISAIKLQSRADCCVRNLADFTVSVSTSKPRWNFAPQKLDICNVKKGAVKQGTMWSMRCRDPPIGQYVVVSQQNEGESLTVCEVEVYGKELVLKKAVGFWPLTGGLKGKDVINGVNGVLRNVISRPGPLKQPYTGYTFQDTAKEAGLTIPADKKIAFKRDFTIGAFIYQETATKDGSIFEWESGDLKLAIKNEKLFLHAAGRMDDASVTSKQKLVPDRWIYVGASFDSKKYLWRLFIDDQETEQKAEKGFRLSPVGMDDVRIGFRGFRGGVSCIQIYDIPMDLSDLIAARSRCKHYLKQPGDRAENVLKKMIAFQSSTWKTAKAELAVDGDDAPYMWRKSCSSTIPDPNNQNGAHWWAAQLDYLRLITSVKVTNRLDCCSERLSRFRMLVTTDRPKIPIGYDSVDVCAYQPHALKAGQTKTFTCRAGGLVGQYVVVTKNDPTPLTLCEVEAYGDKVFPQPKKKHLFVWKSRKIDSVRRTEKKRITDIANLKLCQRECMKEMTFECLAVEYETVNKICRLFEERQKFKKNANEPAIKAAMDGAFVSNTKGAPPKPKPKPAKELMKDLKALKMALQKLEKTRGLLIQTKQDRTKVFRLIVERIKAYKEKIKEIEIGSPKKLEKPKGRSNLESVARSPFIYSEWGSYDPSKKHPKCAGGKIRRWQTSQNWVLNVPADKVYGGVKRMSQCEMMCMDEVEFFCLSYAYSAELLTCHLWESNTAQPGLSLIQTSGYTYSQWGCGSKPQMCTCIGSGDPHHRSFAGQGQTYTGNCKYLAVKSLDTSDYCNVRIETKNLRYFVTMTDIRIFGHTFRIYMGNVYGQKQQIAIDGRRYSDMQAANRIHPHVSLTPTTFSSDRCQVWITASQGGVTINLGKQYWTNRVDGWCGGCPSGGKPFQFRHFEVVDDSGIGSSGGCMKKAKDPGPCEGEWKTKVNKPEYCGYFRDRGGPFGACISDGRARASQLFNDCKFDVCTFGKESEGGARGQACENLGNLAQACAAIGKPIKQWRSAEFCPLDCGKNMEYKISTSSCPATCSDPEAPKNCDMKPKEGCACKFGYVMNEKRKCVVREMCSPRSLADIVFLIDMSERMGPRLAERAKDLVADIVDTIDISPKTTQVSVVPYCRDVWQAKLYTQYSNNRPELVEAIKGIPFCGGASNLPKALGYVRSDIINPSLEKLRPSDQYMKFIVIVTSSDIADDDAIVGESQYFTRSQSKIIWIKYGSMKRPDPKGLTIVDFVFPIPDPKKVDDLVDTFNYRVFKESRCGLGYFSRKTKIDESCKDIDECIMDVCSEGSTCKNTRGAYRCECPKGFCFKPQHGCEEINECYRKPCLPGSSCLNTVGSYECKCPIGFTYHPKKSCVDVDECKSKTPPCKEGSTCENTPGSYQCLCKKGTVYKADVGCAGGDVCKTKKPCKGIAKCQNVKSGYKCDCPKGYKSNGKNGCAKIDLCVKKPCKGDKAICIMQVEQYKCMCPENYEYNKKEGCERIDPCRSKPCKGYAKCTSEEDEFYCGCPGSMYYNEEVGCEEPEIRVPRTKLVVILDDSDTVGEKDFKTVKDAVTGIATEMAGNSKTIDMGVLLMGGKPQVSIPIKDRLIIDYNELMEDVEFNGGKLNLPGALRLLTDKKDEKMGKTIMKKKHYHQLTIVIVTKSNIAFTKSLDTKCEMIHKVTGAFCHHLVMMFGTYVEIVDPVPGVMIAVPTVVEMIEVEYEVALIAQAWMTCEVGFVHYGDSCRSIESTLYQCPFEGEFYAAESVWNHGPTCATYKCLPKGAKIIKAQCLDAHGKCRRADGVTRFPCIQGKKIVAECTCTVKVTKNDVEWNYVAKKIQRPAMPVVLTYEGTAKNAKCVFPFKFAGDVYHSCTDMWSDLPWCSTTADYDVDELWGYCKAAEGTKKCTFDRKEYHEGGIYEDKTTCIIHTCTSGKMVEKQDRCPDLNGHCRPAGDEGYPCDINGRRYETCMCENLDGAGRYGNLAYFYEETVGEKSIGMQMCVYEGENYPMGKEFVADCQKYKCREGKTMDMAAETAFAFPERIDGDCPYEKEDGSGLVCIPVNKTLPCDKHADGKDVKCTCSRNEEGMFSISTDMVMMDKKKK